MTDDFAACSIQSTKFPIILEYIEDTVLSYRDCYTKIKNGMTWIITDKPKYFDPVDIIWTSIDKYVCDNDISQNKKIVDEYGLLKALKLQNDEYGFDGFLDRDENRFYAGLAFNIIREDIDYNDIYTKKEYKDINNKARKQIYIQTYNEEPIAFRTRSKK